MEKALVSVFCMAYNHEKYIEDALKGFVMQKTSFRFEVLVHDDASQDRTADIIREYEMKHPDIIKPIYQTENQYSKNPGIIWDLFMEKSNGKYIAICEGDDCWITPNKIQRQVDYMESHPDCTLCFTNGLCEEDGIISGRRVIPWTKFAKRAYKHGDADYDMGEMILLDYVPTASLLFRKEVWINPPPLSQDSFDGDNYIRYYTTSLGYAHCIDEDTCLYRFGVKNSLSTKWREDVQKKVDFLHMYGSLLDDMNVFTDYKYDAVIQETKLLQDFEKGWLQKDYSMLRQNRFHVFYRKSGVGGYMKYLVKVYCPTLFCALRTIKHDPR